MGLHEFNKNPSRRELITFGALFALFAAFVGSLLRWRFAAPGAAGAVWSAGAAITAVFFLLPPLRRPLYVGWCGLTWPIGWAVSHAVLAVIYYVVFTLTGLALRVAGRDSMQRRLDPQASSYWIDSSRAWQDARPPLTARQDAEHKTKRQDARPPLTARQDAEHKTKRQDARPPLTARQDAEHKTKRQDAEHRTSPGGDRARYFRQF